MLSRADWTGVEAAVADALLRIINQEGVVFDRDTWQVRVHRLPFYDAYDLFELSDRRAGTTRRAFVLYDGAEDVRFLFWKSPVLHQLNAEAPLRLEGPSPEATRANAERYLRFFCDFLSGEGGPFFIVESPEELGSVAPDQEIDPAAVGRIRPLEFLGGDSPADAPETFDFAGTMVYDRTLFAVRLRVSRAGMVEMLDDETLAGGLPVAMPTVERVGELTLLVERAPREDIDREEFLGRLRRAEPIANVRVQNDIHLQGHAFDHPVYITDVRFQGSLVLASARFSHSLTISDCQIAGCLDASNARVEGPLSLRGTTVFGVDRLQAHPAGISLDGLRVQGDLDATELSLTGSATAEGAAPTTGTLTARHMRVDGTLHLGRADAAADVRLDETRIGGDLDAAGSRIRGSLSARGMDVDGMLVLMGTSISGTLDLHSTRMSSIFAQTTKEHPDPLEVGGNLQLSDVECPGHIELEATSVGGSVLCVSAREIGSLRLAPGWSRARDGDELKKDFEETQEQEAEGEAAFLPTRIGCSVILATSDIRGRILCKGLHIGGRRAFAPEWLTGELLGSFTVDDCTVGGDLVLRGAYPQPGAEADEAGRHVRTKIAGAVDLSGSTIEGDVDLRDVEAGTKIRLRATRVEGGVRADAAPPDRPGTEGPADAGFAGTTCTGLDLERLHCAGDVVLTGLRIPAGSGTEGRVEASRCRVEGRFSLFDREIHGSSGGARGAARVPGTLDLTSARADRLILSGNSFHKPKEEGGITPEIVLERASFNQVELYSPLPRRLDLRNLQVDWWEAREGTPPLRILEHLLREDRYKYRSTFKSIEGYFQRQGFTGEAEQVRRWMWNAVRGGRRMWGDDPERPRPSPLTALRYAIYEWFGYGRAGQLLVAFVASFLLTWWIFTSSANVSPSLSLLEVEPDRSRRDTPAAWSAVPDAVWMTTRYHVPMIALDVRQEWRASPHGLTLPGLDARPQLVSAEDWGTLVSFLSWLWWPLFLLSVTGIVRRAGLGASP